MRRRTSTFIWSKPIRRPRFSIISKERKTSSILSVEFGVERFLLVSTGQSRQSCRRDGRDQTRVRIADERKPAFELASPYSSVRFGNVLGSSGSLIPLLKSQIEDGGPVTLTHPEMSRYFMLIPEAVSLVLMSASLAQPGDIGVLRMGEPLKIVDLAKSLMALMGRSEEEVPIVFTGIRPGEKMFEELYLTGDEIQTRHPEILTMPNGDSAGVLGGGGGWLTRGGSTDSIGGAKFTRVA